MRAFAPLADDDLPAPGELYEDGIPVPPSTQVQLLTAADLMGMPTGDVEALAT